METEPRRIHVAFEPQHTPDLIGTKWTITVDVYDEGRGGSWHEGVPPASPSWQIVAAECDDDRYGIDSIAGECECQRPRLYEPDEDRLCEDIATVAEASYYDVGDAMVDERERAEGE